MRVQPGDEAVLRARGAVAQGGSPGWVHAPILTKSAGHFTVTASAGRFVVRRAPGAGRRSKVVRVRDTLRLMRRVLIAALLLAATASPAAAFTTGPRPEPGVTRPVILVGNNWEGTTDIVDPDTFERLDRIDVIPDKDERMGEIMLDPVKAGFFLGVRNFVGEGNDQFNDDVFSSNDGRFIYVSRPSFADVVAIELATKAIVWRAPVDGYRSDHMAITEDGTRLLVSASTGNVVHELDTATGARTGMFPSGDSPHENVYSKDGRTIYHASIGRVYLPTDRPPAVNDQAKGGEFFQIVDNATKKVLRRIDMSEKMAEAGFEGFSGAVRPMTLSPDERFVYFQLSFHHGFVEYDLEREKVTRVAWLPISEEAAKLQREQYLLDSAHHGLALDPTGTKLCVAGTMSDYGAIVDRASFRTNVVDTNIKKPYWSTNSGDGRHCYISSSGGDYVAVVAYDSERVIHKIPVGRHPQRVRNGVVRIDRYAQGKHGERLRVQSFSERSPIGILGWDERFGCRAAGAVHLALVRCEVRLVRGGRVIAAGERFVAGGAAAFKVDVDVNRRGRALLRRTSPRRGVRVTVVTRAVDSVGRAQTVRRRAVVHRG